MLGVKFILNFLIDNLYKPVLVLKEMDKKLGECLENNRIKYILHRHLAVFSVEESQKLKIGIPGLHCKTLFVKTESGKFYLIGLPAEKMLDNSKLRKCLGIKKFRFGSVEELKNIIGVLPGSVSIFGAVNSKKVGLIIDRYVWESKIVGFHPNINTETLEIKHFDLEKFYESLENEKYIFDVSK